MISEFPLRNRVKELRERIGLRQADLADAVGITRQTIIAIEKGRLNPSILISLKVARMLREPVDYVFYLAPGTEALSLANVALEGATDKPGVRKGKKGRPKGSRKPKESAPVDESDTSIDESPEEDVIADTEEVESLEVIPDAEVLAPVPSEEAPVPDYEEFDETPAEVDEVRYELDRDSDAAMEEPQEGEDEPVEFEEPADIPSESAVAGESPEEQRFDASAPSPEEHESDAPVRETKSGQAIWDFF